MSRAPAILVVVLVAAGCGAGGSDDSDAMGGDGTQGGVGDGAGSGVGDDDDDNGDDDDNDDDDDDDDSAGGAGFAQDATAFPLPEIFGMDEFAQVAGSVGCDGGGSFTHLLTDLDGDAIADLIVTDRCDDEGVGTEDWLVYRGDGSGFATTAVHWTLPAMFGSDQWNAPASAVTCDGGEGYAHTLLDIDGDGQPDLVVTDSCDALDVGTTHWLVFDGRDGGFAEQPREYALPDVFGAEEFQAIGGSVTCDGGEAFTHFTVDMTGDGRLDLVLTDVCDARGVGTDTWRIYPGGASGFESRVDWDLPNLFGADEFDLAARFEDCDGGGEFGLTLTDLDGDARPDLVVTDQCDGDGVGTDRWRVALNSGDGFASWTDWALPGVFGADEFEQASASFNCDGGGQFRFGLADLRGSGPPALVVTDYCDAAEIGTRAWTVFESEGDGFADAPTEWTLPDLFGMDEFDAPASLVDCDGGGSFAHTLRDLDGDGALDLVVTDFCDATGVGSSTWSVFRG